MTEKLRKKFIVISVLAVFLVLTVIAGCINAFNFVQLNRHANQLLTILTENDGHFPRPKGRNEGYALPAKMSPEVPFSTRFFTVKTDANGFVSHVDIGKIASITETEASQYATRVLASGKSVGFVGNYKYHAVTRKSGTLLVFLDCRRELEVFFAFLYNSFWICFLGISAVFVLVLAFSKSAIAPVAESYAKQKQFITDASHELKTPLAIISSNTEVLEMYYGTSEWTQSILHQVQRLSKLISSLVALTRMDEQQEVFEKSIFSFSDVVNETVAPFIKVADARKKRLALAVAPEVAGFGDEADIRRLVEILAENAVKYALVNTEILFELKQEGKKVVLKTTNQAANLTQGGMEILFERFYRVDGARSSDIPGYGIGLAIAKSIVTKHKGRISAVSPDGKRLEITAIL